MSRPFKLRQWPAPVQPVQHTIDPATGIWPIGEWGLECGRGFVSAERFGRPGDQVIKRTSRRRKRPPRRR